VREFFQRFSFEGGNGEDGNLIARLRFMCSQLSRQRFNRGSREDMGKIDDPPAQGGNFEGGCVTGYGQG
jgi:hypothetical protein